MGTVFTATSKAAEAPEIEPGMYDLRFEGTSVKVIKGGQYQKNPEGDEKLEWEFTVLDDDGDVMYDRGDPITVKALSGMGFNITSKTTPLENKLLKALCTKIEFDKFLAGGGVVEADLIGRIVQGEVYVKENGWPGVTNIVAARKRRAVRSAVTGDADE